MGFSVTPVLGVGCIAVSRVASKGTTLIGREQKPVEITWHKSHYPPPASWPVKRERAVGWWRECRLSLLGTADEAFVVSKLKRSRK
jgi:hypothetical protein